MKHRMGFNRLGRKSSHRKAMHSNMVMSLLKSGRITTTKAKALEIRRTAEKMITRAKEDTVHNRRMVARRINEKEVLNKLFTEVAPRYAKRPGGYTRILKLGYRQGDAAQMVILELVEDDDADKGKKKPSKKKSSAKSAESKAAPKEKKEKKAAEAPKTEAPEETAAAPEAAAAEPAEAAEAPKEEAAEPETKA